MRNRSRPSISRFSDKAKSGRHHSLHILGDDYTSDLKLKMGRADLFRKIDAMEHAPAGHLLGCAICALQ
jgi:hypothetical protein